MNIFFPVLLHSASEFADAVNMAANSCRKMKANIDSNEKRHEKDWFVPFFVRDT